MGTDRKSGVTAALDLDQDARALAAQAADRDADAPVQDDLFAGSSVFGTLTLADGKRHAPAGRGRPRGSRNKSTAELVKLISATGRHPLLAMAEIVSTPIDVIARTLGCKKIEAAEYHRKVMNDLAQYVAQKQPTAVQVAGANAGMLVINLGSPLDAEGGMLDLTVIDNSEQNQQLSEGEDEASHDAPSHDDASALKTFDE